jgi:hypothetical protein
VSASPMEFKDLLDDLQDAMTRWGEADRDEREAYSRKTQALNEINQAQRSIDAHMAAPSAAELGWTYDEIDRHGKRWHDFSPTMMSRVGKKAAGRELDGRTWDEMPEVPRA